MVTHHSNSNSSMNLMKKMTILPLIVLVLIITPTHAPYINSLHDLLKRFGLPGGLFPKNLIKSFTLDDHDVLEVHFEEPCEARFEMLVRFDRVVRANLSYGGLIGVEGLTQEELFLWLPVKDIIVEDPSSGVILFDIGVALKQLAFSLFEDPPICNPDRSPYIRMLGKEEGGGSHQNE